MRTVSLPKFLKQMLREHLNDSSGGTAPEAPVFTMKGGGRLRHGAVYSRYFKRAVARWTDKRGKEFPGALPARLRALRFHDLPHTCAALSIAAGAHPKLNSARLGVVTSHEFSVSHHVTGSDDRSFSNSGYGSLSNSSSATEAPRGNAHRRRSRITSLRNCIRVHALVNLIVGGDAESRQRTTNSRRPLGALECRCFCARNGGFLHRVHSCRVAPLETAPP
jgi:hypothetical protein